MRILITLVVLSMMACGIQSPGSDVGNDESSLKGGAGPDGGQKHEDRDAGENENEANEHGDGGIHRGDAGENENENEANESADGGDDDDDRDGGEHGGHSGPH